MGWINNYRFNKWVLSIRDKNPNYYKFFVSLHEKNKKIKTKDFKSLFSILIQYKQYLYILPKQPIVYDNIDDLKRDLGYYINFYIDICNVSGYINRYLQKLKKDEVKRFISLRNNFPYEKVCNDGDILAFNSFLSNNNFPYKNQSEVFNDYRNYLSKSNIPIIYEKGLVIIVKVNRDQLKKIGSDNWCIRKKDSWDEYVSSKSKQYIIIDFSYFPDHRFSMIGFTVKNGKATYAYDKSNRSIVLDSIKKYTKKVNKIKNKNNIQPDIKTMMSFISLNDISSIDYKSAKKLEKIVKEVYIKIKLNS